MDGDRRDDVVEWVETAFAGPDKVPEVLAVFPDLSVAMACEAQIERDRRRVARGDRLIGYKVALTSKGMQEKVGVDHPVWGMVYASTLFQDGQRVNVGRHIETRLEPEIAIYLKHGLAGPGVTLHDVMHAADTCGAMIEICDQRAQSFKRSEPMVQVCNAFNWGQIVGGRRTPVTGIDLRYEAMVLSINGEVRATAAAIEVLGHPLNAVVFLANKLAEFGIGLKAGMMVQTGSIVPNVVGRPGDHVNLTFTNIGSVDLYLSAV